MRFVRSHRNPVQRHLERPNTDGRAVVLKHLQFVQQPPDNVQQQAAPRPERVFAVLIAALDRYTPGDRSGRALDPHFIARQERLHTLREVRRRLKPRAPFVVAHFSIPEGERDLWLSRYAAFAVASGIEPAQAETARSGISERLPILTPEKDEGLLRAAGFDGVSLFYAGFAFRGWIAWA